jgi:hypothetical protein
VLHALLLRGPLRLLLHRCHHDQCRASPLPRRPPLPAAARTLPRLTPDCQGLLRRTCSAARGPPNPPLHVGSTVDLHRVSKLGGKLAGSGTVRQSFGGKTSCLKVGR